MKIIDLTHAIQKGMPTFKAHWHTPVSITQMGRIEVEGRETRKLVLGTHTGTHVDAPLHFTPGGNTIDKLPLNRLIGDVSIIDFTHFTENQMVTCDDIAALTITDRM